LNLQVKKDSGEEKISNSFEQTLKQDTILEVQKKPLLEEVERQEEVMLEHSSEIKVPLSQ